MRIKDRHNRDFLIGPTHEEIVTDIARREIKSYRQLPINFYQIQTKFRDEIRPRFGVMRGREFLMKDAYSFDKDKAGLQNTYQKMFDAYTQIFTRLGLRFRAVAADTGQIGGSASHEFHVIAETGEDQIAYCQNSSYAANIEMAEALPLLTERKAPTQTLSKVPTPDKTSCQEVAHYLNIPLEHTVKSLVLAVDAAEETAPPKLWLLLIRGDHRLNDIKVSKIPGLAGYRLANEKEIYENLDSAPGYLGPVNIPKTTTVLADRTVALMSDFVCGANETGMHYTGVNWERDLPEPTHIADIRDAQEGDPSPDGQGQLSLCRGIEVGHVFQLGTKYSEMMKATFLDEQGKPQPFVMGCYGIGVTRILGAAIEQNYDERGIMWPASIAPFELVICPLGYDKNENVRQIVDTIYSDLLKQGIDVILDDRGERPGVMFADWELIGIPHRIVISDRGIQQGQIEYLARRETTPVFVPLAEANDFILKQVRA